MAHNGNGNGSSKEELAPAADGCLQPVHVMEEDHLDCQGRKRRFRVQELERGSASLLEVEEIRDGQPIGWRLVFQFDPEREMPPYYAARRKLAERLATRDVVRDPETGTLRDLNRLIRAQIGFASDSDAAGPDLIVDGEVVSWEELGSMLKTYEGFGLRIEIRESGEE